MKTPPVSLICAHCGKAFEKEAKEYNRQVRKGHTQFYCGLSCCGEVSHIKHPGRTVPWILGKKRQPNVLSPFRWFLLRAKARHGRGATNLTLEYLREVWEAQQGICPFTGWQLKLPRTTNGWPEGHTPESASLDRIDNSVGYVCGNVRFISLLANYARNDFSDEAVFRFAEAVHQHQENLRKAGTLMLTKRAPTVGGQEGRMGL